SGEPLGQGGGAESLGPVAAEFLTALSDAAAAESARAAALAERFAGGAAAAAFSATAYDDAQGRTAARFGV
ncbi:hypothetical protein AB3M98_28965, partial [Mycolicibacterium litorale]